MPPVIIPVRAPCLLERFQNRASSTTGPKAAPNPAQAKDTIVKMELSGFPASTMAIREITITVTLAMMREDLADRVFLPNSCTRFWEILEEAASSWESAVDMVAARIPARIIPAVRAGRIPCVLIADAIWIMTVSELLPSNTGIMPLMDML